MTTTTRSGALRFLPFAVPGFLLMVTLLITPVAPGKATDGLYRVDTAQFTISHHDIDCTKNGTLATCTTPVDGKPLTVVLDTALNAALRCTAAYDGRDLGCTRTFDYGPGSHRVSVRDLDVPEEVAAGLRAELPWWSPLFDRYWVQAALGLVAVLAVSAALASFLLSARPREAPRTGPLLTVLAPVAGVAVWVLSGLLLMSPDRVAEIGGFVPPHLAVPVLVSMTAWQCAVVRPVSGRVRWRAGLSVIAVLSTVFYSVPVLLWITLAAGVPD